MMHRFSSKHDIQLVLWSLSIEKFFEAKKLTSCELLWAVVVAQLVERSLPIPEVRGSNPVIGNIYIEHLFTCLVSTVLKIRKK